MSTNISLFGLSVRITASVTFPQGFTVNMFADDQAPIESGDLETAAYGMGPNGDLVVWSKPAVVTTKYAVIPGSIDDQNLSILHEANRISKKKGARPTDVITIVETFPSGRTVTLTSGMIISGPATPSGSQDGRMNSRAFGFVFEDRNDNNKGL